MAQERDVFSDQLESAWRPSGISKKKNSELRNAAGTFGQLAERLNSALPEERRQAAEDRRRIPRYYTDRRRRGTSG